MTTENSTTTQTMIAVFDDPAQAEQAINDLKVAGFTPDSISVVTRERDTQTHLDEATGNEAAQGALVGSLGGGTLGAVLGWLLAGGTALIPGIGPVVAAGIFGATLSGALIGGTVGALSGALAGLGVPQDEADEYETFVKDGRTLVTAQAATGHQAEAAFDIFQRNSATVTRRYMSDPNEAGRLRRMEGSFETDGLDDYASRSAYTEGRQMDDISTLPPTNTGVTTRDGSFIQPPLDAEMPQTDYVEPRTRRGSDHDNLPPPAVI